MGTVFAHPHPRFLAGLVAIVLAACSGSAAQQPAPSTSTRASVVRTTVAPPSTVGPATLPAPPTTATVATETCSAGQIAVLLAGIQGLTGGTFAAAYWVYNPSPSACALPKALTVDLLDPRGGALLSLTSPGTGTVTLPALTVRPAQYSPAPGTIAYFDLNFTTLDEPDGGIPCPVPTLDPTSLRLRFGSMDPIRTASVTADTRTIEVCKGSIGLFPVDLLT